MTGTADTEAYEFQQIYGLEVVVIPTHMPMIRKDHHDLVFLTQKEKFDAIVEDITDCNQRGQPVLVGTTSIENSELLSGQLGKQGISHEVLNAKQHDREASIIAQAGRPGAVTIATNMAGRGTDIVLGGNVEAEIDALEEPDEATTARPSATSPVASTTSCAAARAARVTPAPRASTCRCRTACCASSPPNGCPGSCSASACRRARPSRAGWSAG